MMQQSIIQHPRAATTQAAIRAVIASLCLLVISGCSNRGLYEGIQTSNRQECGMLPPSQYDECMERNALSYEEYERERKAAAEQPER